MRASSLQSALAVLRTPSPIVLHVLFKGGGADTLKFNLHIIERTKKGNLTKKDVN
jgi:hypothetical protein